MHWEKVLRLKNGKVGAVSFLRLVHETLLSIDCLTRQRLRKTHCLTGCFHWFLEHAFIFSDRLVLFKDSDRLQLYQNAVDVYYVHYAAHKRAGSE